MRAPADRGGPWARAVTVAAIFSMSGASASVMALAWKITTAPPVDVAGTRAQVAPALAAPPTAPERLVPPLRARRSPPPVYTLESDAATPLAGTGPSMALSALGRPTHAPNDLWMRAVHLASTGADVVLTESSLTRRSVNDLENELGPSALILPSADLPGIRIASLAPGSIARAAGLQQGDVITAVNGYPLASPTDLLAAYASVLGTQTAVIELRRGPRTVVLRLRIHS